MSAEDGEAGVGEAGEGDVSIPAVERAQFIIGEADFLFGHFEGLFDAPAGTGDLDEFREGGVNGSKTEVGGEVIGVGARATDEEATFEARSIGIKEGEQEPVEETFTLGAGSGG